MKTLERIEEKNAVNGKIFGIETTFVLFFLAVEFGRTTKFFALDAIFLAATLSILIVVPYFFSDERGFGNWVFGRIVIVGFALLLGAMFKQSLGTLLPEAFRILPLTLLILAAMISCYVQFYGFLKLRPAK